MRNFIALPAFTAADEVYIFNDETRTLVKYNVNGFRFSRRYDSENDEYNTTSYVLLEDPDGKKIDYGIGLSTETLFLSEEKYKDYCHHKVCDYNINLYSYCHKIGVFGYFEDNSYDMVFFTDNGKVCSKEWDIYTDKGKDICTVNSPELVDIITNHKTTYRNLHEAHALGMYDILDENGRRSNDSLLAKATLTDDERVAWDNFKFALTGLKDLGLQVMFDVDAYELFVYHKDTMKTEFEDYSDNGELHEDYLKHACGVIDVTHMCDYHHEDISFKKK